MAWEEFGSAHGRPATTESEAAPLLLRRRREVDLYAREGLRVREIAAEVGVSRETVYNDLHILGVPLRPPRVGRVGWLAHLERARREGAPLEPEGLLVLTGACGVPGCADPSCPVVYGFCHCGCGQKTTIAERTRSTRGALCGYPHLFVQRHCGRGRVARREERRERVAELYEAGSTVAMIASELRVAKPTVRGDLKVRGIPQRPWERARKYPRPTERLCAREGC